jgi:hypothetical protein
MIRGNVGKHELTFRSPPSGTEGMVRVEAGGRLLEVRFRKDAHGVWLELPHGVFGFDFGGERGDDGGLSFGASRRGGHEQWEGLSFARAGEAAAVASAQGARKGTRIRSQMPGKIVRLLVREGAAVEKGQSLLVMEAMKMENEIRAPQAGRVSAVKVAEGQAVETGADLMMIDPA